MSVETHGYRPAAETARPPVNAEINELTANWENHLTHVFANPETAGLLRKLIKKAKKEYPENRDWLQQMQDVKDALENTDDEDEVRTILTEALGSPEDSIRDDDEEDDATMPDEEETIH
jgi:hypothetical protein